MTDEQYSRALFDLLKFYREHGVKTHLGETLDNVERSLRVYGGDLDAMARHHVLFMRVAKGMVERRDKS